jgi:hypothetical protein
MRAQVAIGKPPGQRPSTNKASDNRGGRETPKHSLTGLGTTICRRRAP